MSVGSGQSRYNEWLGWLNRVEKEVVQLHHHREMWRALKDAIYREASDAPSIFLAHYTKLYVDGQAMCVRRLVDRRPDVVSLWKLINDLKRHRHVMTRDRFIALHRKREQEETEKGYWTQVAIEKYDKDFGCDGVLDKLKLKADLGKLTAASRKVIAFADLTVAHIAEKGPEDVSFRELDETIDAIGEMFKRYALLLMATDYPFLVPTIQGDPWQLTFSRPLFPIGRPRPAV